MQQHSKFALAHSTLSTSQQHAYQHHKKNFKISMHQNQNSYCMFSANIFVSKNLRTCNKHIQIIKYKGYMPFMSRLLNEQH